MGDDPTPSVVDPSGRVHGHDNLYVIDASVHVTNGGMNPVLTIMALALRNAEALARARLTHVGPASRHRFFRRGEPRPTAPSLRCSMKGAGCHPRRPRKSQPASSRSPPLPLPSWV
jgi:hypothetical protein